MLGLVATGKRSLRSGADYDRYFTSTVEGNEVELLSDGDVYDTLDQMKVIVKKTLSQTKAIAPRLKGSSLEATCKNIWDFLYHHVQYKKDNPLREQLRTPARTWKDRKAGVDCDCYAIFISSVLTNLNIPHAYRMAGYQGDFQHVYVVVPKHGKKIADRGSYYTIDPVVNQFNYEAAFSKKHDHKMSAVTMLNGFGECNVTPDRLIPFRDTQEIINRGGIVTPDFLQANNIPFVPAKTKDGRAVYAVTTPEGLYILPPILAPAFAEKLKSMVGPCTSPGGTPSPGETPAAAAVVSDEMLAKVKKMDWWWWLAIIAGGWILLTGSDQSEVKPGLNGLSGKKKSGLQPISI